jgi:hypothetical protein
MQSIPPCEMRSGEIREVTLQFRRLASAAKSVAGRARSRSCWWLGLFGLLQLAFHPGIGVYGIGIANGVFGFQIVDLFGVTGLGVQ